MANEQRLKNLAQAVASLEEYVHEPIENKRDLAGTVFGFVMAFELAWKCVQDRIADLGYQERGPRLSLVVAMQIGLIPPSEEAVWSQMLADRNQAEDLAEAMVARIRTTHLPAILAVGQVLQKSA